MPHPTAQLQLAPRLTINFIMRPIRFTIALLALSLAGCATQPPSVAPVQQVHTYVDSYATALVFDPPVLAGIERLDLSRDGRGPSAFEGFDQGTTTYYFLRSDDWYSDFAGSMGNERNRGSNPDNYSRQAISETYGITYR